MTRSTKLKREIQARSFYPRDNKNHRLRNFLSRIAPARFPASEVVLIDCVLTDVVGAVGWRLDQVTQPAGEAPNVHYWEYNSHDSGGRPVDMGRRLVIARQLKLPDDEKAIAKL